MMSVPVNGTGLAISELLRDFVPADQLPNLSPAGITADSREVSAGDLFIALSGLHSHAIDFAPNAIESGAIAVLYDSADDYCCQRIALLQKQYQVAWIGVDQLQQRTGLIASRFHGQPGETMKLIGVTGTDGKTSVTHLLVQALANLGHAVASIGTLGYGMANRLSMTGFTTPDAIRVQSILAEFRNAHCEFVVMEVSSHALDQYRVGGCAFDVAVLTNLGSDHLDYHGSLDSYAGAKAKLFGFESVRARVLNLNDGFGRKLAEQYHDQGLIPYTSAAVPDIDGGIRLVKSQMSGAGLEMRIVVANREIQFQTGLIGAFNIDNCLAVAGALSALGFEPEAIESAMQGLRPIPGRMEYFCAAQGLPAVVIDFAHTEQALLACLQALKGHAQGELYCVFGCGGDRDRAKRPRMAAVAEQLADHVFVTDDNPRSESPRDIMRDILAGFENPEIARVIHDRETAIRTAVSQASPDDLVVIAGKGHEQHQIVADQRLVYSDRQVVEALHAEAGR